MTPLSSDSSPSPEVRHTTRPLATVAPSSYPNGIASPNPEVRHTTRPLPTVAPSSYPNGIASPSPGLQRYPGTPVCRAPLPQRGCVRGFAVALLVTFLSALAPLHAFHPVLNTITPRGGQLGTEVTVTLWGERLFSPEELLLYKPGITVKHTDWITALAYSPDGVLLATADRNGGAWIWEADSGNEFHTLREHQKGIKPAQDAVAGKEKGLPPLKKALQTAQAREARIRKDLEFWKAAAAHAKPAPKPVTR